MMKDMKLFESDNEKKLYLGTWAGALDENACIWFSCFEINGLFKFDTKNKEMEFIRYFENAPFDAKALHGRAFYHQDKMFFMPLLSKDIYIFNIKTHEVITKYIGESLLSRPFSLENHIYFMNDNKIYKFAMDGYDLQEMTFLSNYCHEFASKKSRETVAYPYGTGFIVMEYGANRLLRIDVVSNEVEQFEVDESVAEGLYAVGYNRGIYWLIEGKNQDIIAFEKEKKAYVKYRSESEEWMRAGSTDPYSYIFYSDSNVWALNYYAENLKLINEWNKSVEDVRFYKEHATSSRNVGGGAAIGEAIENKDTVFFLPQRKKQLFLYDKKTGEYDFCEFYIDAKRFNGYEHLVRDRFVKGEPINESELGIDLKDFITCLANY